MPEARQTTLIDRLKGLDSVCTKIARILSGNPAHADHWHNIHGYLRLVEPAAEAAPVKIAGNAPLAFGDKYTGDVCPDCGRMRMVRTGTCATCQDCGASGGRG